MTLQGAWVPFIDDRRIASVRMRTYGPVEILRRHGERVRVLKRGPVDADEVLILQKAYSPAHMDMARRHRAAGGPVVLDLCDNHFANPGSDPELAMRSVRLHAVLQHVDLVSVCTPELAEVVPHPAVLVVNDSLDPPAFGTHVPRLVNRVRRTPKVLWFGTAGAYDLPFGMRDLARILPALSQAAVEHPFELVVMSNSRAAFSTLGRQPDLRIRYVPWGRRAFSLVAAASDIAVIPVEINAVTRGKTSNRVATALQHGLAVVTDPLPSYLAYSECTRMNDYHLHVLEYLRSPGLRAAHVRAGQRINNRIYAPEVIAAEWRAVLVEARRLRASTG